jgi:UDP-GlcNAc:undecaprenyl-phosphate GlcNAc-1-phosphate transferase
MNPQLVTGLLSFALCLAITPVVMKVAQKYQILDIPDNKRRIHKTPVPRMGGVAIFVGALLSVSAAFLWDHLDKSFTLTPNYNFVAMVVACSIIFLTGIVDDVKNLRPRYKLIAQGVAALVVISSGFRIDQLTLAGEGVFSLGIFSIPLTFFWIVGMTNAFNLIDGVDGLAGTFALIGLFTCIGVDVLLHEGSFLLLTASLTGGVMAFLRYNYSPAKIFLGDAGSLLLGFFLSVRMMSSATTNEGVTYILVPLFALAFPITDTSIAIFRRFLRGDPFSRADGRHIHHQLLALGMSARRTVEMLGLFFFGVAAMGMSIAFAPAGVTMAFATGGAIFLFVALFYSVRWLRYHEFTEFGTSIASVLVNARSNVRTKIRAGEVAGKLHQAASIDELRSMLNASAEQLGVEEVALIPGSNRFVGPETRRISPPSQRLFRIDYPIAWERNGHVHEVVLRVWCARPSGLQHIGVESIATRLAPAIEQWLMTNTGIAPAAEEPAARPASSGFRRRAEAPRAAVAGSAARLAPGLEAWLANDGSAARTDEPRRASAQGQRQRD